MAKRRMFSTTITNSARFLMMSASARLLYYDLGMYADDDGFVEAFAVLRLTCASEEDLRVLESRGFVSVLNEELVTHISDWKRNNLIKSDRYQPSPYLDLLKEGTPEIAQKTQADPDQNETENETENEPEPEWNTNGTHVEPQVRLGKDRLGKDRLGEERLSDCASAEDDARPAQAAPPSPTPPPPESAREILVSEGISPRYIDERIDRARDYARSKGRPTESVIREWWANDRRDYEEPPDRSFNTDDFFEAALARSMKNLCGMKQKEAG